MTTLKDLQATMHALIRRRTIFEQAKSHAVDYMDGVSKRPVFPEPEAIEALTALPGELPETPGNGEALLNLLHRYGSPATVAQTGGRYFGFVNGSILPPALAAKWLADTWDQNAGLYLMSPVASHLETLCEKWLVQLFGLPDGTAAGFVSGTSIATLCGLAAGRDELLKGLGWDIQRQGLFGAPKLQVVVGEQVHATVFTALSILGLGRERIVRVAVDEQGCMDPEGLPQLDNRTLLIAQAGNVQSGGFDPLRHICPVARKAGAWIHVDGAFGLWAACSSAQRHLTEGMELADSWSADAHKTLNAPYDNGIILCRNRAALLGAMEASGAYIGYSALRDGMRYTPEMSRRARGVELWATLMTLGRAGVECLVAGLCDHARRCADLLRGHHFKICNRVDFNQVLVACERPELTTATLRHLQRSGICWCGGSTWNGEPVIRISVSSWQTTAGDIRRTADALVAARNTALQEVSARSS
ncbi:MAG: pyridoxal phosphate-dependent decarboxylase family protein [Desulfopila sp.]